MACGCIWRVYSSLQYRASALVAVVGRYTLALSVSITTDQQPQRGADGVVSDMLDASRVSFSERS